MDGQSTDPAVPNWAIVVVTIVCSTCGASFVMTAPETCPDCDERATMIKIAKLSPVAN